MATKVTCDTCGAPVRSGWRLAPIGCAAREAGDPTGEYCSLGCVVRGLHKVGVRRPAFEETRALLEAQRQADELAMLGAFDDTDPAVVAASLPYDPPVAVAR